MWSHSPLIAAPSLAWHPSSHGTVTHLEFEGGGLDFTKLLRGLEKAFKLCIQVFCKETKTFFYMCMCVYIYILKKKKIDNSQKK